MSDNITVKDSTGATKNIAADNIASVLWQRIKLAFSVDGAAPVDVSAVAGLPVNIVAGTVTLSGTDFIGKTGGRQTSIQPVLTMDTTPDYVVGDVYGDKTTLTNAIAETNGFGYLVSVLVTDLDNIKPAFDILVFDSDPTGNTFTDNTALPTLASGTRVKLLCAFDVLTENYKVLGGMAYQTVVPSGGAVNANGSQNLYLVLVAKAAINVATASHLGLRFNFLNQ